MPAFPAWILSTICCNITLAKVRRWPASRRSQSPDQETVRHRHASKDVRASGGGLGPELFLFDASAPAPARESWRRSPQCGKLKPLAFAINAHPP